MTNLPDDPKRVVVCGVPTEALGMVMPGGLTYRPYPGSIVGNCQICSRPVFVGPESQKQLALGAKLACMVCTAKVGKTVKDIQCLRDEESPHGN